MARKSFVFLAVGMVVFFVISLASAEVPQMINYQGKLTTASGGCLNDTVQMTFSIYPDTLGFPADWTETQNDVIVKEGIFNVLLGSVDSIPSSVFDGNIKYLGVQVESDPEMSPRKPIVSTAYAYNSDKLDGMHAGNNDGEISVNNSMLNTNLNADLLDGFSSEEFMPSNNQINKIVRGLIQFGEGEDNRVDFLSSSIDPSKSVVILSDPTNLFLVFSLSSIDITIGIHSGSVPYNTKVGYQIIEYE
jgi:hypothetical protein